MKSKRLGAILLAVFASMPTACAKKSMNERDVRREQLRINAEKKRQELVPLAGDFRGWLSDSKLYQQDASLHLELKDVPENEGGQVDPVLVPTVSGALSLTYGPGPDVDLYSFGTARSDFNATDSRLDLIVTNTVFKEINMSLTLNGEGLSGTWSSPSTSQSGTVELKRTADLYLGGDTPALQGAYSGILEGTKDSYFSRASLAFITTQDAVDSFHVSASVKVTLPAVGDPETFVYEYEAVEFNPLTHQITMRSEAVDLYFSGRLLGPILDGQWFSKRVGLLGPAKFSVETLPDPPKKSESPGVTGNWYAEVTNTRPDSRLPSRLLLGFNAVPNSEAPGGLAIVGSARFYYGPFGTADYVEQRFTSVDYQPYARRLVAVTDGLPKLTLDLALSADGVTGRVTDSSLGPVATFEAKRQAPDSTGSTLAGSYVGFFFYDNQSTYQEGQIDLVPAVGPDGLKLSAALTMAFGKLGSDEALAYRFDNVDFNAVSGVLNLANAGSDIVVKAQVDGTKLSGEWYSTALGRMGHFELAKDNAPRPTGNPTRLDQVEGTYRGFLRNTNPQTNLPDKLLFGLITTIDPAAPRGLRVTGNLRLYYGAFDSTEYTEVPFESLQFDPFRRRVAGKTGGSLRLTVSGTLSNSNKITGTLADDSLGEVGEFEVEKYEP